MTRSVGLLWLRFAHYVRRCVNPKAPQRLLLRSQLGLLDEDFAVRQFHAWSVGLLLVAVEAGRDKIWSFAAALAFWLNVIPRQDGVLALLTKAVNPYHEVLLNLEDFVAPCNGTQTDKWSFAVPAKSYFYLNRRLLSFGSLFLIMGNLIWCHTPISFTERWPACILR